MPTPDPRERLIVALDFPSAHTALELARGLEGRCLWVKVGLELYLAAGQAIVEALVTRGFKVFLDLKLHDIPNTVASAVRTLASSGASLLTVHGSGGEAMLTAAAEAASAAPTAPKLLAVTVLTSMDAAQLAGTGVFETPEQQVLRLAGLAMASGFTGLVCSPAEVEPIRNHWGASSLLVVPGVRPAGSAAGDQKRIATPAQAIRAGASMLVVGRPITAAPYPLAALEAILAEIETAGK